MATRPEDAVPPPAGGNPGARRVLLIVLGLLVLLALVYYLFLRSDPVTTEETAPPPTAAAPEPTPSPSAPAKRNKRALETFEIFAPKDPFRPLVLAVADGTVTGAPAPGAGAAAPGTGDGTGTTAPTGGSAISGDSGSSKAGGHRVRLVNTFRRSGEPHARIQVDGTVYTVRENDRFAQNFQVLSISGDCASLLFGDDQFSLCEGQEILK